MKNRDFFILFVLILILSVLPACSADNGSAADSIPGYPLTITDMAGREVTLNKPAEKIVVLSPSDCEIIYAIGAGGTVIGRGAVCDYPAQVTQLPAVQSGYETNIEQIIALNPDAVIMTVMSQSKEHADMLDDANIAVIVTDAADIAGVYTAIELMGRVTGKTTEADALITELKTGFDEIKEPASGKTVYFEVSPLEWGLWTAGTGTFMNEIAGMTGLINIFGEINGWAEISQEQVIDKNPDFIVTIGMYDGGSLLPADEIKARIGWENIAAVANDNVIMLDSDIISRPGPRLLDAARELSSYIKER